MHFYYIPCMYVLFYSRRYASRPEQEEWWSKGGGAPSFLHTFLDTGQMPDDIVKVFFRRQRPFTPLYRKKKRKRKKKKREAQYSTVIMEGDGWMDGWIEEVDTRFNLISYITHPSISRHQFSVSFVLSKKHLYANRLFIHLFIYSYAAAFLSNWMLVLGGINGFVNIYI
ncbi:hypothetical protein ACMFMG_001644 [Clarireedia jacksonii]